MLASQPQRVRLTSSGRLRRERQRKRRVVRSVNSAQIRGPIVHQPPPTLEQIRPRVGRLGLVADHVRKRRLDHLPRVVGLLGRLVAETRPEAVPGQTCSGASRHRSSSPATSRPAITSLTRRSQRLSKRVRWNRPTDVPPRTGLRFDAGLLGQRRHGLCRLRLINSFSSLPGLK